VRPSFLGLASVADERAAGAKLGKFELAELLSRGERSAVYRAREVPSGRPVAIKVPLGEDQEGLERFRREARVAASLHHRHIVEVLEVGEEGGRPFLAMELVDGGDLAALVAREGRPTAARTLLMMKQAAAALAHLHGSGIVHCDLQPSNLLVTSLGQVKLADFGLERGLDEEDESRPGSPSSAPLYFPPEAAHGRELDERSDLYLLGATFYHALAGRPPFEADDPVERALKYVRGEVPPLSEAAPTAPRELCDLIHRLLRKNPAQRVQSAQDLLAAIERIESEAGHGRRPQAARAVVSAAAAAAPLAPAPPTAPGPPLAALIGGGLALLAVGILIGYFLGRAAGPSAPRGEGMQPSSSVSSETEPAEHSPGAETKAKAETEPARAAWRAAWTQAEADAAALVREQRFGAAMARYKGVARRFGREVPATQVAAATAPIRERAETAYAATVAVAKQLAQEKRFEAARGELLGAIERYGLDELADPARELLASLATAEKQAREGDERQRLEADRRAEGERLKAAEARYQQVMAPVDALAKAWDFRGARAKLPPPDELTAERLEARRDQLERLAQLKDKIIARINTAKPPLRKSAVLLPGINGDLVRADEDGIATLVPGGKPEVFAWPGLSQLSALKLASFAIDPNSGDDRLAAGLLALAYDDLDTAEQELARARLLGADVARAKALLDLRRKRP